MGTNAKAYKISDSITNIVKSTLKPTFAYPSLPKPITSPTTKISPKKTENISNQDKLCTAIDDLLKTRVVDSEKRIKQRRNNKFKNTGEVKFLSKDDTFYHTCPTCKVEFSHKLHLARHKRVGCAMFTQHEIQTKECSSCEYEGQDLNVLCMHKRVCQSKGLVDPKILYVTNECAVCSRSFETYQELMTHCKNFEKNCGLILNEELQLND